MVLAAPVPLALPLDRVEDDGGAMLRFLSGTRLPLLVAMEKAAARGVK